MTTKKTALTMTDSERRFTEALDPDLPEDVPKSLKDENYMLRVIVEEQRIALDMIMRKYREHTDSLTRVSQVDLRKLHYKRYLNTIINQANKMNKMMETARKNLLVILKYEELMKELEGENERLRGLVKSLLKASDKSQIGAQLKESLEVSSQTDVLMELLMESKAVGTDPTFSLKNYSRPIEEVRCTEVVPYVSIEQTFKDKAMHFEKSVSLGRTSAELPIDEAYEVFLNRFASLSTSGSASSCESDDETVVDLEFFEDPSDTCLLLNYQPEESKQSSASNEDTPTSSIRSRSLDEIYDDVQ